MEFQYLFQIFKDLNSKKNKYLDIGHQMKRCVFLTVHIKQGQLALAISEQNISLV